VTSAIYLDHNASTPVLPEVLEAMLPFYTAAFGNPSSAHPYGRAAREAIEAARSEVAALLGCQPDEVIFTGGGTEASNLAIRGSAALRDTPAAILTTVVEHPATAEPCRRLERDGWRVAWIGVDSEGIVRLEEVEAALRRAPDTALVTAIHAQNETGSIQPLRAIADLARSLSRKVVVHSDGAQSVGKIPTRVDELGVDLLSVAGHKLHAPKGIGALYVRKGTKLVPQVIGGHQEKGKRAGTENVPFIIALGLAAELAERHMPEENTRIRALRDKLEKGLLASCPDTRLNGAHRLPNTSNLSFEFVEGEANLLMLDDLGISASSGSACASGSLEPSHVMRAMGVPFTAAHGSIRVSLSRYNTEQEIDYVLEKVPPIIERLRELSPFVGGPEWHGTPISHEH